MTVLCFLWLAARDALLEPLEARDGRFKELENRHGRALTSSSDQEHQLVYLMSQTTMLATISNKVPGAFWPERLKEMAASTEYSGFKRGFAPVH